MSERKRGTFDVPAHGGKADSDLNRWPAGNEPPEGYKKGSSDYPEHGKYAGKGGFIPKDEIADPNGKSPLDMLLEKEEQDLGKEAVDASVKEDEARSKAREEAEATQKEQKYQNIKIVKKEAPKSSGKNKLLESTEDKIEEIGEEFEKYPKRLSRGQSLKERDLWVDDDIGRQPSDKGKTGKKKGWVRRFFSKMRENKERPQDQL